METGMRRSASSERPEATTGLSSSACWTGPRLTARIDTRPTLLTWLVSGRHHRLRHHSDKSLSPPSSRPLPRHPSIISITITITITSITITMMIVSGCDLRFNFVKVEIGYVYVQPIAKPFDDQSKGVTEQLSWLMKMRNRETVWLSGLYVEIRSVLAEKTLLFLVWCGYNRSDPLWKKELLMMCWNNVKFCLCSITHFYSVLVSISDYMALSTV